MIEIYKMKHTLKSKLLMLLLTLVIICMFFNMGCNVKSWDVRYVSRATGDGAGGAIVLYDVMKSASWRDFYAQKISADGRSLWGERGVLIGSGNKKSDAFFELQIVSDDAGGAIVALATYSPPERGTYDYQLSGVDIARIDTKGSMLWQRETVTADQMISDGNGGAIIASDHGGTLLIIKVDSEGGFPWGEDGVFIDSSGYQDSTLQLASDGTGGAIIIWQEDIELQAGTDTQNLMVEHMILAQRVNSEGNLSWSQDGVNIYTTQEDVFVFEPRIVSDYFGAIVIWSQIPEGQISNKQSSHALLSDVYVQKLDTNGSILWQANGIPLGISKLEGELVRCRLIDAGSDGSGGAIIAWEEPFSVVTQRIDANGNVIWQPRGVQALRSESGWTSRPDMVVDRLGGAIVTLTFRDDMLKKQGILLHKLDSAGNTVWLVNDIGVDANDMGVGVHGITSDFILPDGQDGAIIFWSIGRTSFSSGKSYIQRIDSNGKLLWGAGGIRLDR
ncbi:MAG: hypothetical protein Q7T57_02600 [Dehalococcoidales bacterium]|nr:hypothetical protein [Dehalococcoidales bacterium]